MRFWSNNKIIMIISKHTKDSGIIGQGAYLEAGGGKKQEDYMSSPKIQTWHL